MNPAAEQGFDIAVFARKLFRPLHVIANSGESLEILFDVGARLLARDAELVGEPKAGDAVHDSEIDRLRASSDLAWHAFDWHAEYFRGSHGVNVEPLGEGVL